MVEQNQEVFPGASCTTVALSMLFVCIHCTSRKEMKDEGRKSSFYRFFYSKL